jgi:hypothetical protein
LSGENRTPIIFTDLWPVFLLFLTAFPVYIFTGKERRTVSVVAANKPAKTKPPNVLFALKALLSVIPGISTRVYRTAMILNDEVW